MGSDWNKLYQGIICTWASGIALNDMPWNICGACKDKSYNHRYSCQHIRSSWIYGTSWDYDAKEWNNCKEHNECSLKIWRRKRFGNKKEKISNRFSTYRNRSSSF